MKLLDIERLVKVNDFNLVSRYNIEFDFNTTSIFLGITLIQSDSNTKIYVFLSRKWHFLHFELKRMINKEIRKQAMCYMLQKNRACNKVQSNTNSNLVRSLG